ncbi:MAG: C4-dicarboxylate ABC transporter [Hyphomicrobiales bacterium]|nr:MAG: C4-dicarboxylate ABC transporter [Hyphomicrobiales bacterium]
MRKTLAVALLGAAVAVAGMTGPAFAKKVRWNMGAAFPSKLVQLGSLGVHLSKTIKKVSGGDVQLKFFEPKALVPPLEMFDAIKGGSLDAAWSVPGYWQSKEPALSLFSAVPFGPGAGEYIAWMYYGGGEDLMNKVYNKHGLHSLVCGVIAPEASGWFRKEIKSVADLKGLKMRFFGLGGKVMQRMGAETQLLAAGDIYPALERGTIDATEFSMPAIDLNLGFYNIAKHYYFPGWHQQSTIFELLMNKAKWDGLNDTQRAQISTTCRANVATGLAEGEAIQAKALITLKSKGVTIHRWSPEILGALEKTWNEVAGELAASDASFKEAWDSLNKFRAEYKVWKELGYLN